MFDIASGGTFMEKEIEIVKKLLNGMQDNHSQQHVKISSTKKVNSVTQESNEDLTTQVDELISITKGKEEIQVNAITNATIEEADFMARNFNHGSNYQKRYSNPEGVSNNFNK
jgi:hypothetical protein